MTTNILSNTQNWKTWELNTLKTNKIARKSAPGGTSGHYSTTLLSQPPDYGPLISELW